MTVGPIRDGMNWYVYTGNGPVNYVDFWGLATEDAITAAIDELGASEYGQSSTGAIVVDILKILMKMVKSRKKILHLELLIIQTQER